MYRYKLRQKPYTKTEIIFPKLKIESVDIDKLQTYFEVFDTSIGSGLLVESQKDAETNNVKIRQHRLNHKRFTVKLNVNSEKDAKAAVRIFLGPKFTVQNKLLGFTENYKNFYEMDIWLVDCKWQFHVLLCIPNFYVIPRYFL